MKHKLSILPLLLLMLAGCAALGVPQADTFNKRIVVANGVVESTTKTIETLYVAGKLTKDEAQEANEQAGNAAVGIDIARQTHTTDPAAADAKLTATLAALNALNAYLENRK